MKIAIFTALVLASATQSYAMDLSQSRQSDNVEIAQAEPVSTAPETLPTSPVTAIPNSLLAQFKAVCDSKAVKSKKLIEACSTQTPPPVLKSGKDFKMSKNGAEVKFIFANLELINN